MRTLPLFLLAALVAGAAIADTLNHAVTDQTANLTEKFDRSPVRVTQEQHATTKASFRPPVEITIVARTSSQLRLAYAADQVIFNWEEAPTELRIDGGQANGRHQPGRGQIPIDTDVTIRWIVTQDSQQIYVDDDLRFEHHGDYTRLNAPISIWGPNSKVTVASIKTKPL
jgi:hypothetical protein